MLFSKVSRYIAAILLLAMIAGCAQTGSSNRAGKKRQPNITPLAEAQRQTTTDYAENYDSEAGGVSGANDNVADPYTQDYTQDQEGTQESAQESTEAVDPYATANEIQEPVGEGAPSDAAQQDQDVVAAGAVANAQNADGVVAAPELTLEQRFGPNPYLTTPPPVVSEQAKTDFKEALILFQSGADAQAEAKMKLLVDAETQLSGPAYNLAYYYYQKENFEDAIKYAQIAVERNTNNVNARNLLAASYRAQSKFAKSEQAYLDLLQVWGGYLPAYKNLGILYDLYMGQSEKAYPYYKQYNTYTNDEDKQVVGWALVIERKMKAQQAALQAQQQAQAEADTSASADQSAGQVAGEADGAGASDAVDNAEPAQTSEVP